METKTVGIAVPKMSSLEGVQVVLISEGLTAAVWEVANSAVTLSVRSPCKSISWWLKGTTVGRLGFFSVFA